MEELSPRPLKKGASQLLLVSQGLEEASHGTGAQTSEEQVLSGWYL